MKKEVFTQTWPAQISTNPPDLVQKSDRLIELELMHRWTTTTYKSICGALEADWPMWQIRLPRDGLQHPYLLQGLLALAALEIAAEESRPDYMEYVNRAMEYHGNALQTFRSQLGNIRPENQHAAFAFSIVTMAFRLAIPQFNCTKNQSMVENMIAHFELLSGTKLLRGGTGLPDGLMTCYNQSLEELPKENLDPSTEVALSRLKIANDEIHEHNLGSSSLRTRLQAINHHSACQKAIYILIDLFQVCRHPLHRGRCLAWLGFAGREFVVAIQESDPAALLALMHWAALVQKSCQGYWYARSIGSDLARELMQLLVKETLPTLRMGVAWVQEQVRV